MKELPSWTPPQDCLRITTIDAHTAGEPLRVILGGYPEVEGKTILEKRHFLLENYDHLRTSLMWEPRGHADMYGCLPTEPTTIDGDLGVIFMHNEGYSSMCGHGIIGLVKVALDTGLLNVDASSPNIKLDTPAGRVTANAIQKNGVVESVSFDNVPSFVYALDQRLIVPEYGEIIFDIAYGGAFYVFVQAAQLGLLLNDLEYRKLINIGMMIKRLAIQKYEFIHPFEKDLSFLYGTIFIGPPENPANHSRNVCVFADGEVDRCPTGTGVSARAAIHHARGDINIGETFTVESILGTCFTTEIHSSIKFGPYDAVIPRVTGSAYITGLNTWVIDPNDPLQDGFILR